MYLNKYLKSICISILVGKRDAKLQPKLNCKTGEGYINLNLFPPPLYSWRVIYGSLFPFSVQLFLHSTDYRDKDIIYICIIIDTKSGA